MGNGQNKKISMERETEREREKVCLFQNGFMVGRNAVGNDRTEVDLAKKT